MRLVLTSDTHSPVRPGDIPDGDVFVHAGDLLRTGYVTEWPAALDWLAALPHKIKLFVPGNHDFHLQVYPGPALQDLRRAGVVVVGLPNNPHYETYLLPNKMSLLGLPYVTGLPRWAFNTTEVELCAYLKRVGRHDVVISHAPVYGILDQVSTVNSGITAYRSYLLEHTPLLWVHGHIHECYGSALVEGCQFYNVAMCNRKYEHANAPVIVDL